MRRNRAVWVHSCTSSSSSAAPSGPRWVQLLAGAGWGSNPPASMAVPSAIRSGDALRAVRARWVTGGQERSDSGEVSGGQERSDSGEVTGGQERSDSGEVTGGQ